MKHIVFPFRPRRRRYVARPLPRHLRFWIGSVVR